MSAERPDQLLTSEILRHHYSKDVLMPSHHEMSRLATIASGFEIVISPDRNIELFLVIPVHVTEPHIERTVRVNVVTFISGRNTLSRPVAKLNQLRTRRFGHPKKSKPDGQVT